VETGDAGFSRQLQDIGERTIWFVCGDLILSDRSDLI